MIGLSKEAGEYADAKLRELISGLSLETKVITEDFSVGYIFETSYGKAKEERLLKTRLIGRSEDTLVLDLGKHNGIFLCGKVPYSWLNCMILHRKPPTDIHDHIPILEELLSDYELTFSPCEDRFIDDPHPDL